MAVLTEIGNFKLVKTNGEMRLGRTSKVKGRVSSQSLALNEHTVVFIRSILEEHSRENSYTNS